MINKPQTLKGFRDFLPYEKRRRDFVAEKIKQIFELFGFEPLETPTLEYASLLLGKYGKEADKLIYSFKDRGDREIALRYDQTVPSARVLSQYQNILPKYFRRYQIQNVFRADNPQKGRYREFTQCDIDIFGSTSPIADAEIIATTYFAFKNVGYPGIKILINDRVTLFNTLTPYQTSEVSIFSIIQTLDKLTKAGKSRIVEELTKKGLAKEKAEEILKKIESVKPTNNLYQIIKLTTELRVPKEDIIFTSTLARGLDYYTGMIFEVIVTGYEAGSCGGGGRYDKLLEQLGGVDIPAVGIAFGFDRMVEAAEKLDIIPSDKISAKVLVSVFDEKLIFNSLSIANKLRQEKIATEVFPGTDKLDKQLKYADRKGIPFVIIVGPEEVQKNIVKLKNMKSGEQSQLTLNEIIAKLKCK